MIRLSISSFAAVAIMLLDSACLHSAFYMGKAVHYRQLMLENHGNKNEPLPETAISMKLAELKMLVEQIGQKGNFFLDSVPATKETNEMKGSFITLKTTTDASVCQIELRQAHAAKMYGKNHPNYVNICNQLMVDIDSMIEMLKSFEYGIDKESDSSHSAYPSKSGSQHIINAPNTDRHQQSQLRKSQAYDSRRTEHLRICKKNSYNLAWPLQTQLRKLKATNEQRFQKIRPTKRNLIEDPHYRLQRKFRA